MKIKHFVLILLTVVVFAQSESWAETCTDGVDCYCDRVRNPFDPYYDANVALCEDFEAVTLHDDVNVGGWGAPLWTLV